MIRNVKRKYEKYLLRLGNVVSVGIGWKTTAGVKSRTESIVVGVTKKLPVSKLRRSDIVPAKLDDVVTDVVEVGIISIPPPVAITEVDRTRKVRPLRGGFSIGNIKVTAGTLGCTVWKNDQRFILSNAHVLTPDPMKEELIPSEILQPGPYDGGTLENDLVGHVTEAEVIKPIGIPECPITTGIVRTLNRLYETFRRKTRFVALLEEVVNKIDAAIALPTEPASMDVEGIGVPTRLYDSTLMGKPVIKSGRTTGITNGIISAVDVIADVNYGGLKFARLEEQIMIESTETFSSGGDSGSVIFEAGGSRKLCGLLFAGNEDGTITYANDIYNVFDRFKVHL